MERIKNFIYDKSDLLIAMLIIAVAALIIWLGISNIMKPYTESADAQTTQTEESAAATTSGAVTDSAVTNAASNDSSSHDTTEDATKEAAKIIIQAGENSDQIAEKLIAAGAISDKNAFYTKLDELGIASKIQLGSFNIPAGSTLEDVCKIITKTN